MLEQIDSEEFSLKQAVGGVRGAAESIVPLLLFLVAYTAFNSLKWPLIIALVSAGIFALLRIIQGQSLKQAVTGFLGVAICAGAALWTGKAQDFFLPGFLVNAAYLLVVLLTILVRRPLIGWAIAFLKQLGPTWRQHRAFLRASYWATWMWVALFALRLVIQLPLYWAGQTAWLGTLRITMGIPLFALCVWGNWVVLRQCIPATPAESKREPSPDTP